MQIRDGYLQVDSSNRFLLHYGTFSSCGGAFFMSTDARGVVVQTGRVLTFVEDAPAMQFSGQVLGNDVRVEWRGLSLVFRQGPQR